MSLQDLTIAVARRKADTCRALSGRAAIARGTRTALPPEDLAAIGVLLTEYAQVLEGALLHLPDEDAPVS